MVGSIAVLARSMGDLSCPHRGDPANASGKFLPVVTAGVGTLWLSSQPVCSHKLKLMSAEFVSHRAELAARIRCMRIAQGFSTRRFSAMIGISKTYLLKLETAQASPTFDMLERVAAGLDCSVRDLIDFEMSG